MSVFTKLAAPSCDRRLKKLRYIYSTWTGEHYCWPGEGCDKK